MSDFSASLDSDPACAGDVLELARTAAVLPVEKRKELLRYANELRTP